MAGSGAGRSAKARLAAKRLEEQQAALPESEPAVPREQDVPTMRL